jgi:hypothetical protein
MDPRRYWGPGTWGAIHGGQWQLANWVVGIADHVDADALDQTVATHEHNEVEEDIVWAQQQVPGVQRYLVTPNVAVSAVVGLPGRTREARRQVLRRTMEAIMHWRGFIDEIVCPECTAHAVKFLEKTRIPPTPEALESLYVEMHNQVNKFQKKPQFTVSESRKAVGAMWSGQPYGQYETELYTQSRLNPPNANADVGSGMGSIVLGAAVGAVAAGSLGFWLGKRSTIGKLQSGGKIDLLENRTH